jgi:lysine-N-methylase
MHPKEFNMNQGPLERQGIALKYMTEFSCIGNRCEANCCSTPWSIHIDRKHYARLKEAMSHSRSDRERFRHALRRNRSEERSVFSFARIVSENGHCPFLEPGGLCEIQRRFGESMLSQVCRTYPRLLAWQGRRLEVSGSLSCPEAARRCLLDPEGTTLVALDPSPYENAGYMGHRLKRELEEASDPYYAYADTIRDILLTILARDRFPLEARLFSLASFAGNTAPFLFKGTQEFGEDRLAVEVDKAADHVYETAWAESIEGMEVPLALPMTVVQALFLSTFRRCAPELRALLFPAWAAYTGESAESSVLSTQQSEDAVTLACDGIVAGYRARRDRLLDRFQPQIDACMENYARQLVFTKSYMDFPNLLTYAHRLILQTALVKFLFVSHPRVSTVLSTGEDEGVSDQDDPERQVTRALVDAVFRFARGIEHNKRFLPDLEQALDEQGMQNLAHAALLARL